MVRYLGIDYGTKRVGIALSDDDGMIAFPEKVLTYTNMTGLIEDVIAIVKKNHIAEVVVGVPVGFKGDTPQTEETRVFIDLLENSLTIPVHTINEILTTRIAEKNVSKKNVDASAAALILQSYLDKKS